MSETPFIQGYNVKPYYISPMGVVVFTDGVRKSGGGTSEFAPNQKQCEAYGYTYNESTGTCMAFDNTTHLTPNVNNTNNSIDGVGNITETGASNISIMGENNTVKNLSRNNLIVGSNNEITGSINNSVVIGHLAEATTTNSIVLGGNAAGDRLAERQNIQLMYGVQTTDGTTTASYLNNTSGSYFVVPDNTIIFFHAYVVAVRIGGSYGTGAVGDYGSWVERGVVINKSGTLSVQRERDTIKTSGTTTGWVPTAAIDGTNFVMNVKGRNNVTIEWNSNISLTQIKTGVAL
tara:strand:- start:413 stop:1282 length:870 start_codon:yes stop_codon:yes gene_type:complete